MRVNPNDENAYFNLGNTLLDKLRIPEAIESYQRALQLNPGYAGAHTNLGNIFLCQGKNVEAVESFKKALELNPNDAHNIHSNILFSLLHYMNANKSAEIYDEHRKWNERYAVPLAKTIQPHVNEPDPKRKLRIGYVSSDFCTHPVASFLEPLLAAHNHNNFEVICYANNPNNDTTTQRLKEYADGWREIHTLNDQQVADLIRQDKVDILIDLSGHTGGGGC
jgi:predicted O-linked N-acetylglucosamine transferase (SPINDLY family)